MSSLTVFLGHKKARIPVLPGETLLEALRRSGFSVDAPCGGNGRCGNCSLSVEVSGERRLVPACSTFARSVEAVFLSGGAGEICASSPASVPGAVPGREGVGAAADIGTTTLALRLLDLATGEILGLDSRWNAQAPYGADVISRIAYSDREPKGLETLRDTIRRQLRSMLEELCAGAGLTLGAVRELWISGNTVMQHIFAGLSPSSVASAPFRPQSYFDDGRPWAFPELPGTAVFFSPCVSGYVGGDICSGLLACSLRRREGLSLFLDIGTNGEMALGGRDGLLCCSVASGPAFEGAEISCGMASRQGAVSGVRYREGALSLSVIGGGPPRGLCGSGLIELLQTLLELGLADGSGRLLPPGRAPEALGQMLGQDGDGNGIVYLTADRSVYFTAGDLRKLQLAKAAVAAGIETLLAQAGVVPQRVDRLLLAGGFGSHLNPAAAAAIGMLPAPLADRTEYLGNSSLAGAAAALLDPAKRRELLDIRRACRYIELSGLPGFNDRFVDNMYFSDMEEE